MGERRARREGAGWEGGGRKGLIRLTERGFVVAGSIDPRPLKEREVRLDPGDITSSKSCLAVGMGWGGGGMGLGGVDP